MWKFCSAPQWNNETARWDRDFFAIPGGGVVSKEKLEKWAAEVHGRSVIYQ
jgi:hypothetical protein